MIRTDARAAKRLGSLFLVREYQERASDQQDEERVPLRSRAETWNCKLAGTVSDVDQEPAQSSGFDLGRAWQGRPACRLCEYAICRGSRFCLVCSSALTVTGDCAQEP